MRAETRETALEELARFEEEYEAKYSKAVDCLAKDVDTLFTPIQLHRLIILN